MFFANNKADLPLIIAEAGVNHEGDKDAALRLIEVAARAGADAIKFQSYTPERFVAASDTERLERVRRFSLDHDAHLSLAEEARRRGIVFCSSAISEDWVAPLAALAPVIKLASGDIDFDPVIIAAAQSGRQVILSTGCANLDEVERAVETFGRAMGPGRLEERLMLMHCVSAYPTPLEQANLNAIPTLKQHFGLQVGWSNHVIGPAACHAAVALGADAIEIHITETRTGRTFRDHELSFEPDELTQLCRNLRDLRHGLGDGIKRPQPCEAGNRAALRKGIVAARDLAAGHVLTVDDLAYARPAAQFFSTEMGQVLGQRLTDAVQAGHPIARDRISGR